MTLAPGQLAVPNVTLTRKIAEGGMGSVWEGNHLALHTTVAVKFVLAELGENEEAVARFEREATAAARIKSPHVVQVLDHGLTENDGVPYIVMELLEGEDLEARLDREPRLPLDLVAHLVGQAAKALTKAHSLGIVHRDIKPSNVFLTDVGGDTFVKLLDFGIARLSMADVGRARVTQTGAMLGTPVFMSPEQMTHAKDVGPGADLWSLGVVAYLALTGRLPFDEETIAGIAMAIERGVFPAATSFVADLPPNIDKWFSKIFKKDPKARFASAREMADALGRIADVPVSPASVAHNSNPPPPVRGTVSEDTSSEETPSEEVAVEDEPTHVEDRGRIEEILEDAVRDAANAHRGMDSMSEIADTAILPMSSAAKGASIASEPAPTETATPSPARGTRSDASSSFVDDKTSSDDRVTTFGNASERPETPSKSASQAVAKTAGPVAKDEAKKSDATDPSTEAPRAKGPTTFMGLSEAETDALAEKPASRSGLYTALALGLLALGGAAYGVMYMNGGGASVPSSDSASAEPAAPTPTHAASSTMPATASAVVTAVPSPWPSGAPTPPAASASTHPSAFASAPKPPTPNRLPRPAHSAAPATSGGPPPTGQPTPPQTSATPKTAEAPKPAAPASSH